MVVAVVVCMSLLSPPHSLITQPHLLAHEPLSPPPPLSRLTQCVWPNVLQRLAYCVTLRHPLGFYLGGVTPFITCVVVDQSLLLL